jgi:hypothetical protein
MIFRAKNLFFLLAHGIVARIGYFSSSFKHFGSRTSTANGAKPCCHSEGGSATEESTRALREILRYAAIRSE